MFSEPLSLWGWSAVESWGGTCSAGREAEGFGAWARPASTKQDGPHSSALCILQFHWIYLRASWKENQQEVLMLLSSSLRAVQCSEMIAVRKGEIRSWQPALLSLWHRRAVISAFRQANWSLVNSGPHRGSGKGKLVKMMAVVWFLKFWVDKANLPVTWGLTLHCFEKHCRIICDLQGSERRGFSMSSDRDRPH